MWHQGIFKGYWWQAKVHSEGSRFGIGGGRVSKLVICKGEEWRRSEQVYGYDRGLDFDRCPAEILAGVLAECYALPMY